MTRRFCRECSEGKHPNCDGTAWDDVADDLGPCVCDDTAHIVEGLTVTPFADAIAAAHLELAAIRRRLNRIVEAGCPEHDPVQHRDGKPPWCRHCGRSADGILVRVLP